MKVHWKYDRAEGTLTYRLMQGDRQLAVVQEAARGGWYWYAMGKSSGQRVCPKLEQAKAEALEYIRSFAEPGR